MSSIIFRRLKFKEQKLASEKPRGTDKTLKRHITVINVDSSIFKIVRYLIILTRYGKILLYFNVIYRRSTHNKKYHSGIRGIYITNTSTTMVFANEKTRSTTITVPRLLLLFP